MTANSVGQTCDGAVEDDPILPLILGKGGNQRFKGGAQVWNNVGSRNNSLFKLLKV